MSFYDTKDSNLVTNIFSAVLAPLVTAKEHQGKGCGKALLEWGCQYAKDNGMPCYLMSLPGAKGFYLKHGFEVVDSWGKNSAGDDVGDEAVGSAGEVRPLLNTLMRMK